MDLGLAGRRALVTGGSKGIGRAIAETLAAEGCHVALCSRNAGEAEAAAEALRATGVEAFGSGVDVGDKEALTAWVGESAKQLGGLDIVVANVSALAIGDEEESWAQQVNVDLMHTVRMVKAALPLLEQSDAGAIVAISSVSGREIDFACGPYGTVKAALIHYIQGLAHQLAGKNIRANTVSPGNIYFEGGVWNTIKDTNQDLYQQALALNPSGRMGTPEEVARATAFLASPAATYISGTNLVVDGALTRGVQV
ncbi:MAG: SDR family NAD(P)-dependent oxidoreductase [Rhodospirillales bacterium]